MEMFLDQEAQLFQSLTKNSNGKPFEITHPDDKVQLTLAQAVNMVYWSLKNSVGGEICVPKTPL